MISEENHENEFLIPYSTKKYCRNMNEQKPSDPHYNPSKKKQQKYTYGFKLFPLFFLFNNK